jgi:hypothetical protein
MMERSSVELSRFKVNIPIIAATAEEAYLREKVAVKNSNNKNDDDKKKEELARLEKVAELLKVGSSKLNEAISSSNSNDGKRKELLEQAFYAYVDIVPYLGKMPYLTVPVLQQIKNIEKLMELEMEKSVNGTDKDASINVDEVMKVARESLL